jgi:hypothetical protein
MFFFVFRHGFHRKVIWRNEGQHKSHRPKHCDKRPVSTPDLPPRLDCQ